MINMTVKNSISLPKFDFQEDLRYIAKNIFIPLLAEGINNQTALDGSPLKPNDAKYTERKVKSGLSPKILIATGRLYRDFIYKDKGKRAVVVTLKTERKAIGGYLMDMGKNFFGISERMEQSAINYMNKKIKATIDGGTSK